MAAYVVLLYYIQYRYGLLYVLRISIYMLIIMFSCSINKKIAIFLFRSF